MEVTAPLGMFITLCILDLTSSKLDLKSTKIHKLLFQAGVKGMSE